ncbi:MAG: YceI family protein [Saprospiraceae bacterium]|jgi:polyisoprenoid-binding protein YceI|nr:YceI family protein [Candidatus Defluviibacterium haderslevense]MBK7244349.1 YceI family protein [Candidatus Defluviibacterium haderslevense]MBK8245734.1 YceI family protein [Candidatus Defluviibacterium haderslevense]
MKKIAISFLTLFVTVSMISATVNPPVKMAVDAAKSTVKWTGTKISGTHTGMIKIKSGELVMDQNNLTGGMIEIDMTTITNTDMQGEYSDKLVGHLKADDFFGVDKFPTASLKITSVTPKSNGNFTVKGDLTIKGISNPIEFDAMVDATKKKATSKIAIDRTKYNIKYGSSSFFDNLGDKAISNNFDLDIELALAPVATAQKAKAQTKKKATMKK